MKNSYNVHRVSSNVEGEIKRLKAQVNLFWEKEVKIYRDYGLTNGMNVLECGSGPGFIIEKILSDFSDCFVTGVEIDPYLIEVAINNLDSKDLKRYDLYQQSIMKMEFEDNYFDFVLARMVLEHLPDPLKAVKEMFRVLKPGGKAVLVDNDFKMHLITYPEIPEIDDFYDAYCKLRVAEGGNPTIGRQLPVLMRNAGLTNVNLEITSAHNEIVGDAAFLKSEGSGIASQLMRDGYLAKDVMDRLVEKWYKSLHCEGHCIFRQIFVAGGEKGEQREDKIHFETKMRFETKTTISDNRIIKSTPEKSHELMSTYLWDQIETLLEISQAELEDKASLIDLGFDSLMAVELIEQIKNDMGISIKVSAIFDGKTISEIAEMLCENIHSIDISASAQSNDDLTEEDEWEEGQI